MIAIYARQSIDKKDSISIEGQIDLCKKEVNKTDYKIYSDKGYSGGNTNRPAFESMIEDIKQGVINSVVVYRLDRISRSILDFADMIKIFDKYKISFISCTEKFDTSSPMGKAMLYIIMVFAQLERETIQIRLKDNVRARGKKGFFMGGTPPYGFDKKQIEVDGVKTSMLYPNQLSKHVMAMFDIYSANSTSLADVRRYLNKNNVKSSTGKNWPTTSIARLLKNPVYVKATTDIYYYFKAKGNKITNEINEFIGVNGCYHYGKEDRARIKKPATEHVLSLALHEGIINADTWLKCQYKLQKNKAFKRKGTSSTSWLSGLTKCGYCGYTLTPNKIDNHVYLRCSGRNVYKVCTHKASFRADKIESEIKKKLFDKIETLKDLDPTTSSSLEGNSELSKLKISLATINNEIEQLLNKLDKANDILMKYINNKIVDLDNKRKNINGQIEKIIPKNSNNINKDIFNAIDSLKDWNTLSIKEKNEIAKIFIDKITVKEGYIEIEWKF